MTSQNANQLDLFPRDIASVGKGKPRKNSIEANGVKAAATGDPLSVTVTPRDAAHDVKIDATSVPDSLRANRLLSDKQVAERYSISRPSVWRWVKVADGFPTPIQMGVGTTRWALEDLEAYERSLCTKSAVTDEGDAS